MENLIGIDIADPGDVLLVEQKRFERLARSTDHFAQCGAREVFRNRVGTELGEGRELDGHICRVINNHLAEGARVNKPALGAVVEVHHDVRMGWTVGASRREEYLAAHPQVDHHRIAGVERHDEVLPAPLGAQNGRVGQAVDQRLTRRPTHHTLSTDIDSLDPSAGELLLQTTPNGLDLRQLGHRSAQCIGCERSGCLFGGFLRTTEPCSEDVTVNDHLSVEALRVIGAR